jgi:hypothetical protein
MGSLLSSTMYTSSSKKWWWPFRSPSVWI